MYTSQDEHLTLNIDNKEEANIYKLVDVISSIQKKISNLLKSMEHTKKNELYQKLQLIEDEIIKKKKKINDYIREQKQNEINFKKMKFDNDLIIKKLEYELDEINQRINNIVSGGKNNDKEIYQISNDKIDKIIMQKKNEDELRDLNIDYNTIIVVYQNLLNVLEVNINKRYQLDEKLNMLKEEKNIVEDKIIEYISKKESFEEVSKIYLLKFFNEIMNMNLEYKTGLTDDNLNEENKNENNNIIRVNSSQNNNIIETITDTYRKLDSKNNYLNNNITNENLKINLYELNNIDINTLCNEIAIQLILSINSYLKNIYIAQKSISNSMIQNSVNKKNKNTYNLDNTQMKSKIIYNSKENNSFISLISSKIKKEILTFMNSISNKKENNNTVYNYPQLIDDFFTNLSKSIINYLNYYFSSQLVIKSKDENSSEFYSNILLLSLYLKFIFKKFYLDKIIQNECDFLNNQYKNIEKNIKSFLELTMANINKLNSKKQEYDKKLNEIKRRKQLLQENLINDKVHISMKDKAYFDLTKKSNELIDNKKQINEEFNLIENEYEQQKQNIYKKILDKKKKLKYLEGEKNVLEDKIAKKNKIIMNEIEKLKKLMDEKFKMIKVQIDLYKKKYGNNFDLYDKFIEKINKSLRLTSKSLMHRNHIILNKSFSNNFYTPGHNTIAKNRTNISFYKPNKNINKNNTKIKNNRPFSKDAIMNIKKTYNNKNNILSDNTYLTEEV